MKIAVLGAGYVGLVSAACFAEFGVTVTCVDQDSARIEGLSQGVMPLYEPGLDALVAKGIASGHLRFSTELAPAMDSAEVVFIAVGTPARRGDGYADLTHVYQAAQDIAPHLKTSAVVVTKSTVPVGTGREIARILRAAKPGVDFSVGANPEFLREGSALGDFMRPDRVVIGVEDDRAATVLKALYRPLYLIETPMVITSLETAEMIKYAANTFLATKIAFINEIADLCEKTGADVQMVAKGMGLDGRIGRKFLHAGPGYGGSCLPKDTAALMRLAKDADVPLHIVEATARANAARKNAMAARIIRACDGDVTGKTLAILGLTFKPNTDDMRESPSLAILPALQHAGALLRAYDPAGMNEARKHLTNITFCRDSYGAMQGAEAVIILTEWNEFRALDLERAKASLAYPRMIDLRNIYRPEDLRAAGFEYTSVGRCA